MNVYDLNADELQELKCSYLVQKRDEKNEPVSYSELADVDSLVSDEDVFEEYGGIDFTEDDFFCNG